MTISDLPFNLYVTTNDIGITNMLKEFNNKHTAKSVISTPEHVLYVWELDWMECYLDYNKLEDMLLLWPESSYHLLCYGDAMDQAGEMGTYNPFGVMLKRSVHVSA